MKKGTTVRFETERFKKLKILEENSLYMNQNAIIEMAFDEFFDSILKGGHTKLFKNFSYNEGRNYQSSDFESYEDTSSDDQPFGA